MRHIDVDRERRHAQTGDDRGDTPWLAGGADSRGGNCTVIGSEHAAADFRPRGLGFFRADHAAGDVAFHLVELVAVNLDLVRGAGRGGPIYANHR